jgi:hypothetical protein
VTEDDLWETKKNFCARERTDELHSDQTTEAAIFFFCRVCQGEKTMVLIKRCRPFNIFNQHARAQDLDENATNVASFHRTCGWTGFTPTPATKADIPPDLRYSCFPPDGIRHASYEMRDGACTMVNCTPQSFDFCDPVDVNPVCVRRDDGTVKTHRNECRARMACDADYSADYCKHA